MNMLPTWYKQYKELIEKSINKYLIDYFSAEKNTGLDVIKEAALYSVKGGKRIRSIFALEFYLSFTGYNLDDIKYDNDIIKFCIALELLHAFSLIHDDLPSMDNDVLRRGEPTVWKKYGEANAVLIGDMLNSMAFEILGKIDKSKEILLYFGEAVGIKGMLGGQVLDLYYENNPDKLTLDNLIEVHNKKTGALIECSIVGGIIIANGIDKLDSNKIDINKFFEFGKKIGLAFQVKDDLLDVEGTVEETGKSVGDGEEKGFVYFMGIDKTRDYLNDLINKCESIISDLNSKKLDFLVEYIGNRKK